MFDSDGNLTGLRSSRVVGDTPVDIFTPGDGGDSMFVEFAEAEIALGDSAGALDVKLG